MPYLNGVYIRYSPAQSYASELESQDSIYRRGRARRVRSPSLDASRPNDGHGNVRPDRRRRLYDRDLITIHSTHDTVVVRETTAIDDCVSLKT
jgi:hypothetical protein